MTLVARHPGAWQSRQQRLQRCRRAGQLSTAFGTGPCSAVPANLGLASQAPPAH